MRTTDCTDDTDEEWRSRAWIRPSSFLSDRSVKSVQSVVLLFATIQGLPPKLGRLPGVEYASFGLRLAVPGICGHLRDSTCEIAATLRTADSFGPRGKFAS